MTTPNAETAHPTPAKITPPQMADAIARGEVVRVSAPDFSDPTGMARIFRTVEAARSEDVPFEDGSGQMTNGRWVLAFEDNAYPMSLITCADHGYERTYMNEAQATALRELSRRYDVEYRAEWFTPAFGLPPGYVAGWIGGPAQRLYVGVDPNGAVSS